MYKWWHLHFHCPDIASHSGRWWRMKSLLRWEFLKDFYGSCSHWRKHRQTVNHADACGMVCRVRQRARRFVNHKNLDDLGKSLAQSPELILWKSGESSFWPRKKWMSISHREIHSVEEPLGLGTMAKMNLWRNCHCLWSKEHWETIALHLVNASEGFVFK